LAAAAVGAGIPRDPWSDGLGLGLAATGAGEATGAAAAGALAPPAEGSTNDVLGCDAAGAGDALARGFVVRAGVCAGVPEAGVVGTGAAPPDDGSVKEVFGAAAAGAAVGAGLAAPDDVFEPPMLNDIGILGALAPIGDDGPNGLAPVSVLAAPGAGDDGKPNPPGLGASFAASPVAPKPRPPAEGAVVAGFAAPPVGIENDGAEPVPAEAPGPNGEGDALAAGVVEPPIENLVAPPPNGPLPEPKGDDVFAGADGCFVAAGAGADVPI
jgi:hypothetical protein